MYRTKNYRGFVADGGLGAFVCWVCVTKARKAEHFSITEYKRELRNALAASRDANRSGQFLNVCL